MKMDQSTNAHEPEIRDLCIRKGYGYVIQQASLLWAEKDPLAAHTVGPCATFMAVCPCCNNKCACEWCGGTGMVTEKVAELMTWAKVSLSTEQKKIDSCKHDFAPTYYDPEKIREPTGWRHDIDNMGKIISPKYIETGWDIRTVPRWSRKCEKCGKVESTKKTIKPYFGETDHEA